MSSRQLRAIGESLDREALSPSDRAMLKRIRFVSHALDDAFQVPGTNIRFGLDPVLGVLPGVGDSVASLVSLYIVAEGYRAGLPRSTLLKMLALVGVDTVIGSIPVLGTVFDAVWKANKWNANTLISHLEQRTAGEG